MLYLSRWRVSRGVADYDDGEEAIGATQYAEQDTTLAVP